MSKIALTPNASGTGTFTLAAPNSNTSRTITLPDEAGEVLVNTATGINVTGNATFADNGKAIFGAGSDLQIYHNSANNKSYIEESGTGNLVIRGSDIDILAGNGESAINVAQDGAVTLYNDSNAKLATTSTGVDVTGTLTSDGLNVTRTGNGQIAVLQTSASRGFSFESQSDTALQIASVQGSTNLDLWANTLTFSAGAAERMRIDASGNLLLGTTSSLTNSSASGLEIRSNGQLKVGGSAAVDNVILSTGTTGTKYFISHYQNGTYVGAIIGSGVGLSLSSASDYRLKENVSAITGATERLKQLNPSRFNFVSAPDTTFDGFLAHEVQSVVPEAVTGTKDAMRDEEYEVTPAVYEDVVIPAVLDEDGNELEAERTEQQLVTEAVMGTRSVPDYQGIDQSKLVPLLTAALQEALTEISDLKARVTALEAV